MGVDVTASSFREKRCYWLVDAGRQLVARTAVSRWGEAASTERSEASGWTP